jgi:cold shock CspA family protein
MGIFEKMQQITKGKEIQKEEQFQKDSVAKVGDTITGYINNLRLDKGYGFITSEQLPFERIFFHWTGLRQDTERFPNLKKRMKVEFVLQHDSENGYRAIKIRVL